MTPLTLYVPSNWFVTEGKLVMEHWSSLKSCFASHEKSSKQCKHIHLHSKV